MIWVVGGVSIQYTNNIQMKFRFTSNPFNKSNFHVI